MKTIERQIKREIFCLLVWKINFFTYFHILNRKQMLSHYPNFYITPKNFQDQKTCPPSLITIPGAGYTWFSFLKCTKSYKNIIWAKIQYYCPK